MNKIYIAAAMAAAFSLVAFARDMPIQNGRLVNALNANQNMIINLPPEFWEGHEGGGITKHDAGTISTNTVDEKVASWAMKGQPQPTGNITDVLTNGVSVVSGGVARITIPKGGSVGGITTNDVRDITKFAITTNASGYIQYSGGGFKFDGVADMDNAALRFTGGGAQIRFGSDYGLLIGISDFSITKSPTWENPFSVNVSPYYNLSNWGITNAYTKTKTDELISNACAATLASAIFATTNSLSGHTYDFNNGSNFTKRVYEVLTDVIQSLGGSITNAPNLAPLWITSLVDQDHIGSSTDYIDRDTRYCHIDGVNIGCELSTSSEQLIAEQKDADGNWNPYWDIEVTESSETSVDFNLPQPPQMSGARAVRVKVSNGHGTSDWRTVEIQGW